jgi:ribulose kinase
MSAQAEVAYYIGVDVGTDSVRAGLFTTKGKLIAHSKHPIQLWINYEILEGSYEQSSEDIWSAVKHSVKDVIKGIDSCDVKGIGFDATCSLVVVDGNGCPVTVSPTHEPHRNVILWQDHRAIQEANEINALAHPVLRYVGGVISPEMEPPKLLWLRRHLYDECWRKASYFFDLVDYLTYKSTDAPVR